MSDVERSDNEDGVEGFECRTQFKELLGQVNNHSQQTIQRITQYALKQAHRPHYRIMYACIRERMIETPTLNRLPLLYILDSICQQCNRARRQKDWIYLVSRDLDDILQEIIPDTEPINASAAKKCIKAWRSKSVFTAEVLDPVESRVDVLVAKAPAITERPAFSTKEIMRKIEEERDRHKRQREEGWYRPDPSMEDLGARKRGPSATPGGNKSVGVKGDEFSEMWEKIPIPENREWEILSEDLRRFDAEHGVHL